MSVPTLHWPSCRPLLPVHSKLLMKSLLVSQLAHPALPADPDLKSQRLTTWGDRPMGDWSHPALPFNVISEPASKHMCNALGRMPSTRARQSLFVIAACLVGPGRLCAQVPDDLRITWDTTACWHFPVLDSVPPGIGRFGSFRLSRIEEYSHGSFASEVLDSSVAVGSVGRKMFWHVPSSDSLIFGWLRSHRFYRIELQQAGSGWRGRLTTIEAASYDTEAPTDTLAVVPLLGVWTPCAGAKGSG